MKMKPTALLSARFLLIAAIIFNCGLAASSVQAGYIVTLEQVGPDVVATGTGAIDLAGLTFVGGFSGAGTVIEPNDAVISTGVPLGSFDLYEGASGPPNFGSGTQTPAASGSGDRAGILAAFSVTVPFGYTSNNPLSDSATYFGQTFASLGAIPGTYKWTWGTGLGNQNFTLQIGPTAQGSVPDSGATGMLLLLGLTAAFGLKSVLVHRPA